MGGRSTTSTIGRQPWYAAREGPGHRFLRVGPSRETGPTLRSALSDQSTTSELASRDTCYEGVPLGGCERQTGSIRTAVLGVANDDLVAGERGDLDAIATRTER